MRNYIPALEDLQRPTFYIIPLRIHNIFYVSYFTSLLQQGNTEPFAQKTSDLAYGCQL